MFPLFHIGNEVIYSYPLIIGIAWGIGYILLTYFQKQYKISIPHPSLFFSLIFFMAWVGAKVLFIISSQNYISLDLIKSENFWLGGGFVFYGGLIAGLLTVIIYATIYKIKTTDLSFLVIILSLGHAIGRIGCFMAGCCYGETCELPWSVHLHGVNRHPVQLYESISLFILSVTLYKLWTLGLRNKLITVYIVAYGVIRFCLEFFRGDKIRGELLHISTSQWVSIIIIFICAFFYFLKKKSFRR